MWADGTRFVPLFSAARVDSKVLSPRYQANDQLTLLTPPLAIVIGVLLP